MLKAKGSATLIVAVITGLVLLVMGLFFWRVVTYEQAIKRGDLSSLPQFTSNETILAGAHAGAANTTYTVDDASAPSIGPKNAPLTVVEFLDFQCPYCEKAFSTVREMQTRYGDRVRFVVRNFPLTDLHPYAMSAAEAGSCAAAQGKFWPMHDHLFALSGATQGNLSRANIDQAALQSGLDMTAYQSCMNGHQRQAIIRNDMAVGTAAGVRGTPTFFFNDRRAEGVIPPDVFEQLILSMLKP